MAKKRKAIHRHREPTPPPATAEPPVFASPFKDLKKLIEQRAAELRSAPPGANSAPPISVPAGTTSNGRSAKPQLSVAAPASGTSASRPHITASAVVGKPSPDNEDALFREAFEGVRPLGLPRAQRLAVTPQPLREIVSEDAEVLAELSDLVSGQGTFELTETEEYVEGARHGLDPRLLSQLRRGEFSVQAHLDLHGMIQPDAKEALTSFIVDSVRKGRRAVLIVHGRGLRSPGGLPVLKHAAAQWLSHGIAGGYVLAFATARPSDGGAGAVYVLLRRERRRAKFDVLQGAKRRD
jgi:DNA-nicking Smr family endonuclease